MPASLHAWVCLLASRKNGTLYFGATTDLRTRLWQHRIGAIEEFTKRFGVNTLVYFEVFHGLRDAIAREKEIKDWMRKRKIGLIEAANADWADLAASWFERGLDPSRDSG